MLELIQPYVTDILKSVLSVAVILLLAGLQEVRKRAIVWFQSKTTESQRVTLRVLGEEAFAHAETVFKGMGGQAKLDAALDYATQKLRGYGIELSNDEIKASIHKAWIEQQTKVKPESLTISGTSSDQKVI